MQLCKNHAKIMQTVKTLKPIFPEFLPKNPRNNRFISKIFYKNNKKSTPFFEFLAFCPQKWFSTPKILHSFYDFYK